MKTRKLISLMLAILMLVGALSVGTFAAIEYRDVPSDRWSADDIAYATEKSYMNGVGDGRFNPDGTMERAMIVTVLYRMAGAPKVNFVEKFKDVPAGKYYSDAVIWASSNNITNGATATTFEPEGKLTREQMATFFARYADYSKHIKTDIGADITGYSDYDSISSYAVTALSWANRYGIIKGDTETTISPKKPATREQFAAILHRFDESESEFTYRLLYNEPTGHSKYTEREYPLVKDADFYVAVDGNDSADGTLEHPFATFARAKEAVRELKKTKTSEIKVAFMAGNYGALTELLTTEDSGSEEAPITYCAYGDGDVTFSNGIDIKKEEFTPIDESDYGLFFEKNRANIYKVNLSGKEYSGEISAKSELFSETSRYSVASYPSRNPDGEPAYLDGLTTKASDNQICFVGTSLINRIGEYHTLNNASLTGFLSYEWYNETLPITGFDKDSGIMSFGKDPKFGVSDSYQHRVYISNVSEELDTVGEFFVDPDTETLYIYGAPDSDYTLSTAGTFMRIEWADYITIRGINFRCTTANAFNLWTNHFTMELCRIFGVGGDHTFFMFGKFNRIDSCEMSCLAGGGVTSDTSQDYTDLEVTGGTVTNCLIHDFGQIYRSYYCAVHLNNAVGGEISHNEIYNAPHEALSCGGIDNKIEYNVVHDVTMDAADMGAVYIGRSLIDRGNQIRYNLFYNMGHGKGSGAFAIYLDDGLAGYEVYGNIFYNNGFADIYQNGGRDTKIHDNVFIHTKNDPAESIHSGSKYYNMGIQGEIAGSAADLIKTLEKLPAVGTPSRAVWEKRWPEIFTMDMSGEYNFDDINCPLNTSHTVLTGNYSFGNLELVIEDGARKFADKIENNPSYTLDENPLFTDPTHGDYTIREGVDCIDIPFDKMGRY